MKAKTKRCDAAGKPVERWKIAATCLFLAGLTWFTFLPVLQHGFVNYDDDVYVYEHPIVTRGLTGNGVAAAFTISHAGNWHPLTTLSHQMDCEFSGLNAGAHHRTNLLLHMATVVLLFLALRGLTLATWPSAAVAAVFAVHPLRVESVAWIAERKDVLSGLFFVLTLWAYARYARAPGSVLRYALVVVCFTLGLMSKPMLVTLPFVLLLLDYWPLRRFAASSGLNTPATRRLVLEKVPLLLLSAALCVVTFLVQEPARQTTELLPLAMRVGNAVVSYTVYLLQSFWPVNLAVFYPYPTGGVAMTRIIAALLVLGVVSSGALHWRRQRPYLLVGWLWFLGMLVPVIGLVQVGMQAHADRYTYLPQIGLVLAVVWAVTELSVGWKPRAIALSLLALGTVGGLAMGARLQIRHWRDNESLWKHTLAVTPPNAVAESNLANALLKEGRVAEAVARFQAALALKPDYADARNGLGLALLQQSQTTEAITHFERALEVQPGFAAAHNNLGMALLQTGRAREAIPHLESALQSNPDQAETHNNLGYAFLQTGQVEGALTHYRRALELKPDYAAACNNLAWLLATFHQESIRNGGRAVELAELATQLTEGNNLIILRTLAAAYAEAGRFPDAIQTASRALQAATQQDHQPMANTLRRELALYQAGQPLRDPSRQ